jgi:hypothetical protein
MPDIVVVPIKSDFEKQYDRQLEVAKKILKSMQAGLQRAEIIQQFSSGGLMGSGSKTKNR